MAFACACVPERDERFFPAAVLRAVKSSRHSVSLHGIVPVAALCRRFSSSLQSGAFSDAGRSRGTGSTECLAAGDVYWPCRQSKGRRGGDAEPRTAAHQGITA